MKNKFSKNLKFLRIKSGKNQTDIGSQLNKAHTTIGNWEKGISEPNFNEIEIIANLFKIQPGELLYNNLEESNVTIGENISEDVKQLDNQINRKEANNETFIDSNQNDSLLALKDEIIENLKSTIKDKNSIILMLTAEVDRLKEELQKQIQDI
ncbi:Helix-turn-helix [Arachidicoccus rhizosphaerae]|uniref:Helix-turn-helix n=1 Tax=Arachidicoccus rhizosphaerae TaxID=551991 RepID=A0A1H3YTA6_9BACT|nr:helix-turn-helix transcriptional regulator [Arachidicoccus rhizosphaerae]SEA14411.1 Helix-turn-helix [Arachidicoccus rhizosphaerae]